MVCEATAETEGACAAGTVSDAGKDFQLAVRLQPDVGSQLHMQTTQQGDEQVSTVLASFVPEKRYGSHLLGLVTQTCFFATHHRMSAGRQLAGQRAADNRSIISDFASMTHMASPPGRYNLPC